MAFTATVPVIVFLFQLAVVCTVSTLRQYSSFKKLYNISSATQNTLRIVWKMKNSCNNGLLETWGGGTRLLNE